MTRTKDSALAEHIANIRASIDIIAAEAERLAGLDKTESKWCDACDAERIANDLQDISDYLSE